FILLSVLNDARSVYEHRKFGLTDRAGIEQGTRIRMETTSMLPYEPERPLMEEFRSPSPMTNASCIARFHPEAVDKFSIVAFPLAFTFFNLIYWWHYLSQTFDYKVQQITSH
ncbi:hypothetical protein OSTOST_08780, partial [Ostertagia ostertagi]